MNWDELIDTKELAKLLPAEQSHFASPVKEALAVFLSGLSSERQAEVLASQYAIALPATVSQRLGALAQSCPVLHKLGQTLAREPRLASELRHELQKLESLPPTVPLDAIERTLIHELGPLANRGIQLDPPAIAEASVAVVIPFSLARETSASEIRHGVFKVLKPDIEGRLVEELNLLDRVGAHLDERCAALRIPSLDYRDAFRQVREKLSSELELTQEQSHLRKAREFYADEPQIQIPAVLDHCSPRVTAMERVVGSKLTDGQFISAGERDRFRALVSRALFAEPMFASSQHALFHGDPHAGNLFRTSDGCLAILDWSLVGSLPTASRVAINQILLGAITMRPGKVCAELENLSASTHIDRVALATVVNAWMKKLRRGEFPGIRWLVGLLDDATQTARLRVESDLMLFRKSLLTIDGVLHELGAGQHDLDTVLLAAFFRQFTAEWWSRWSAAPTCRRFGTRLSNLDLTETLLHLPWTIARCWHEEGRDLLIPGRH